MSQALNHEADLLVRGESPYRDWSLRLNIVAKVWFCFGRSMVDVFAYVENMLFFYMHDQGCTLCRGHDVLYTFRPGSDSLTIQSEGAPPHADPDSSTLASLTLADEDISAPEWTAVETLAMGGHVVLGRKIKFHPHPKHLKLWAWPVSGII